MFYFWEKNIEIATLKNQHEKQILSERERLIDGKKKIIFYSPQSPLDIFFWDKNTEIATLKNQHQKQILSEWQKFIDGKKIVFYSPLDI